MQKLIIECELSGLNIDVVMAALASNVACPCHKENKSTNLCPNVQTKIISTVLSVLNTYWDKVYSSAYTYAILGDALQFIDSERDSIHLRRLVFWHILHAFGL